MVRDLTFITAKVLGTILLIWFVLSEIDVAIILDVILRCSLDIVFSGRNTVVIVVFASVSLAGDLRSISRPIFVP